MSQAITRSARAAQEAAKAMLDAQDRASRREAYQEAKAGLNQSLRAKGPRSATVGLSNATPEQRAADAADERASAGGEPIKPEPTREEVNAAANAAIRGQRFGNTEEEQS